MTYAKKYVIIVKLKQFNIPVDIFGIKTEKVGNFGEAHLMSAEGARLHMHFQNAVETLRQKDEDKNAFILAAFVIL